MTSSSFKSSEFGAFGSFGDFTPSSPLSSAAHPLDLTHLPPELVVIVKNIQKRDPTTRAKGVQDLQIKIKDGLDEVGLDSLLGIWVLLPLHRQLTLDHPVSSAGNRL